MATLHLPQMLYIWPLMAFFSLPILYPYLSLVPVTSFALLPVLGSLESIQVFKRGGILPRFGLTIFFLGIACMTVLFNTSVHPFTLADNRHYMFYIFRRLMQPWWVRYAVTPLYFMCAWSCMVTLGSGPPLKTAAAAGSLPDGEHSATTSFVIIWVATSALQLITAPLVEPRYFILPWIFWRIHLPLQLPPTSDSHGEKGRAEGWDSLWQNYDHRLWLETAWLLAINAATCYIFLNWEFYWPQEPGKMQRFMW